MMNVTHVMAHYQDVLNQIDIESNERQNETEKESLNRARQTFELLENPLRVELDKPYLYRIIIKKNEKIEFQSSPLEEKKLLIVKHTLDDTITRVSRDINSHYWPLMIRLWRIVQTYPHNSHDAQTNKN